MLLSIKVLNDDFLLFLLHGTIVVAMKVDWGRRTVGIALYCTVSPNLGWIS
jgi:hypothetical protein